MNADAVMPQPIYVGIVDPQSIMAVVLVQSRNRTRAQYVHGHLFQPSAGMMRQYQNNLGTVVFCQSLVKRIGDTSRREILIFNVNPTLCRRDGIDIKLFNFANFHTIFESRLSACDGH